MKLSLLVLCCFLGLNGNSQTDGNEVTIQRDYSLAKVGFKIHGVYVFLLAEPYFEYDYIATVEVKITWTGSLHESFEKVITKAQKKYTNFNGIIFQTNDLSKADLIRFKELDVSKGGFAIGQKVSFIQDEVHCVGEIVKLGTGKEDITVQHITSNGFVTVIEIDPVDLTPISEETFNSKKNALVESTKTDSTGQVVSTNYGLNVGDLVEWKNGSITYQGTILEFDGNDVRVKKKDSKLIYRVAISELKKVQ